MGEITRVSKEGSTVLREGQVMELFGPGNTIKAENGNFRFIVKSGKLATQKRISDAWVTIKTIS